MPVVDILVFPVRRFVELEIVRELHALNSSGVFFCDLELELRTSLQTRTAAVYPIFSYGISPAVLRSTLHSKALLVVRQSLQEMSTDMAIVSFLTIRKLLLRGSFSAPVGSSSSLTWKNTSLPTEGNELSSDMHKSDAPSSSKAENQSGVETHAVSAVKLLQLDIGCHISWRSF